MAALLMTALLSATYLVRFDPRPRYVQLDVGQGDAALFRAGREAVIIDVGPEDSYDLLRYLRHEGLSAETIILSHLDEDHAGALGTLLESEIVIREIVMPVDAMLENPGETVSAALTLAKEKGIKLREIARSDTLCAACVQMTALAPQAAAQERNDSSLVLHGWMEGVSFLLTGDLPSSGEPDNLPRCDVLKVAHHGSKNATSASLLAQVQPELALISVGADNWYGHPNPAVLDRLKAAGARTMRTDEWGCITLRLDDGTFRAEGFLEE